MRDSGYNESTFDPRGTVLISGFEEEVLVVASVVDTGSWIEQSGIADYRRIGPTGPTVPMVLAITASISMRREYSALRCKIALLYGHAEISVPTYLNEKAFARVQQKSGNQKSNPRLLF